MSGVCSRQPRLGGGPRGPGRGSLGENWVYITAVIIWPHHGPVTGNERVSSWKIPDARLHTTETETETENSMRVSENPTATATFQNVTDEADNAQLRSKKTSPDLNYTAESKSPQISKEPKSLQENPGSTNRLHRRVPRPRLCFRTTRFSPITPN